MVGSWSDRTTGNGKPSGGAPKPAIIVSKRPLSLTESPLVEPELNYRALKPKVQRGGPGRQSIRREIPQTDDSEGDDDEIDAHDTTDTEVSDEKGPRMVVHQQPPEFIDMANPDRSYDMWPGKVSLPCPYSCSLSLIAFLGENGELKTMYLALLPDDYTLDRTLKKRPWICPIRTCRKLYGHRHDLGQHWKVWWSTPCLIWSSRGLTGRFSAVEVVPCWVPVK